MISKFNITNYYKLFLVAIVFVSSGFLFAQIGYAEILPELELLKVPGVIEDEGTHFVMTDSEYLNVVLDSTESIKLRMESVPEMVTMFIKSTSTTAASTQITLSGFNPNTTYYQYQDDYHNLAEIITDENGSYSYTQDLSKQHLIFIQLHKSTKFIRNDVTGGDCYLMGGWDISTKTCILTQDLNETIQIDADNITLDGNGYTITGDNTGVGVYFSGKVGVTIKNLNIRKFTYGIYLDSSSSNTLTNNTTTSSSGIGISLYFSHDNTLTGNTANFNGYYGIRLWTSDRNVLISNTSNSNSYYGIYILEASNNNILDSNIANSNAWYGIYLLSNSNTLTNNTADLNNLIGIYISFSSNNTLTNNVANANSNRGIYLFFSSGNILQGNTTQENNYYDIDIVVSTNTHCNNTIENTIGSGGRPIKYFNSAVDLSNEVLSELILCNADDSNIENVIIDGSATKKNNGLFVFRTDFSNIKNVNSSNNYYGINLITSSNNSLISNTVSSNSASGIRLDGSNNNILNSNTTSYNPGYGFYLNGSNSNTLADNTADSNSNYGVIIYYSTNNEIYNNNFINNRAYVYPGSGTVLSLPKPSMRESTGFLY